MRFAIWGIITYYLVLEGALKSCPNKLRAPNEAYATAQQAHQSAKFAQHEMGAYEIAHDRTAPHDA